MFKIRWYIDEEKVGLKKTECLPYYLFISASKRSHVQMSPYIWTSVKDLTSRITATHNHELIFLNFFPFINTILFFCRSLSLDSTKNKFGYGHWCDIQSYLFSGRNKWTEKIHTHVQHTFEYIKKTVRFLLNVNKF